MDSEGNVNVKLGLTTIGCPLYELIVNQVAYAIKEALPEAKQVNVELVPEISLFSFHM